MRFNLIKSLVKVFRVWRNKEALKMECNKRNRNIRYAIFRDSDLKKISEYLVLQSNIFRYFCDRFSKLKMFFPFLDRYFLHFWEICQNEMSHFFDNGSLAFKGRLLLAWLLTVRGF